MARTLTERMIGAAMLDVSVYEEVEHDTTATTQAAMVVAIVAACGAIGAWRFGGALGMVVSALAGWLVWAAITWFIGTRLFRGTATLDELLRTLGFAQAPGVLLLVLAIPLLGTLAGFFVVPVVAVWTLVTGVVAIRQALDVDTGTAVLTALAGWVVKLLLGMVFGLGHIL
jgi:hypothetical protein